MSGKFNWSLNDPSATARQMRDTQRRQREDLSGMSNALTHGLGYVSGGAGYTQSKTMWSISGNTNSPNSQSLVLPYDPRYDMDLVLPVPASGRFLVSVSSYITIRINAYTGSTEPVGINIRMGMIPYTYDGAQSDPGLPQGIYGGSNAFFFVWSANGSNAIGVSSSSQQYAWKRDSDTLHVRTRRFYLAAATNANNANIAMPSGSWYSGSMDSATLQVTPMYTGSVLPS